MKSVTGAHTGTGSWLLQRATAVLLAVVLPGLLIGFLALLPLDFATWRALIEQLWVRVLLLLTGGAVALHAWVGMRDIVMDYVPHTGLRLLLLLGVILTLAGSTVMMLMVLWQ